MKSYRHFIPALRIHQGAKCLDSLAAELDRVGSRRAVILCGNTLAQPGSPMDAVRAAMGDRLAGVYAGVRADTPLADVERAVSELRGMGADAIVAVGGGSAITTARAVNVLLSEQGHARDLCTARQPSGELKSPKLLAPKLPMIAVPTTPTTATVKAGSAILDTEEGKRLALYDPKTRACAVFIDPALVDSAPAQLVVSAGLNTLALALEGLMSLRGDPLADAMLIHATRLLASNLPIVAESAASGAADARADLMAASILGGHGSDYTGAGMAIPVGHAISTRCRIDMGLSDAIMLPHVVRFNAPATAAGIQKIATALGVDVQAAEAPLNAKAAKASLNVDSAQVRLNAGTPEATTDAVVHALERLFVRLKLPRRLRDVGVARDTLAELAAISFDDWYLQSNPRRLESPRQVEGVLQGAW